jgi:hypothetical protein
MKRVREENRELYNKSHRDWEHRIQEEAGCHMSVKVFGHGYSFLKALKGAEVVEV